MAWELAQSHVQGGAMRLLASTDDRCVLVTQLLCKLLLSAECVQLDAIHRASRQTQLAAGAQRRDHRMHVLGSANDRIHRASLDALGATDAVGFHNPGHLRWLVRAACAVVGACWYVQHLC